MDSELIHIACGRAVANVIKTVEHINACTVGGSRSLHRRKHKHADNHQQSECNDKQARHNSFLVVCLVLVILFHTVFLHKFGFGVVFVKVCLQIAVVVHRASLLFARFGIYKNAYRFDTVGVNCYCAGVSNPCHSSSFFSSRSIVSISI